MLNEIFKFCRKTCPHDCRPCHIPILNVPPFIFFHYRNRFTGAPPAAQSCQSGFSLYVNFAPTPTPPTLTLTPRHTPSLGKQELKKEVALIPPAYIERYSKQILQYSLSSGTRKSRKVVVKFHMLSGSYHTVSVDDVLLTRVQSFNFDKTF